MHTSAFTGGSKYVRLVVAVLFALALFQTPPAVGPGSVTGAAPVTQSPPDATGPVPDPQQEGVLHFPETGHTLRGPFRAYWEQNGGLAQFGYPLTEEYPESVGPNKAPLQVQYFERAVFEHHPENSPPYDVLLSLLGARRYADSYGPFGAPGQAANPAGVQFTETGHTLGGAFLDYWQANGGLMRQGFPISDEFVEVSDLDGKTYTVQYFERAVFELHPENAGTPYHVLLSQLGASAHKARHGTIAIPAPYAPDLTQMEAQGSDRYLAWAEVRESLSPWPNPRRVLTTLAIRAMSLRTGAVQEVSSAPGLRFGFALDRSAIVWAERDLDPLCPNCPAAIKHKDLATGQVRDVATAPIVRNSLAVAGGRVAWLEPPDSEDSFRLKLHDLNTGSAETLARSSSASASYIAHSPTEVRLSARYAVWTERTYEPNMSTPRYEIKARPLHGGDTRIIAIGMVGTSGQEPFLALSGSLLVWADPSLHMADLDTGATPFIVDPPADTIHLTPLYLMLRGGTLLWHVFAEGKFEVWGMDLTAPNRAPLKLGILYNSGSPAIAGDWLVTIQEGRLVPVRLWGALAGGRVPPDAPPHYASPNATLIARNVEQPPVSIGPVVYWLGRGTNTPIHAYDIRSAKTYVEYIAGGYKTSLTTDGGRLAWIEIGLDSRFSVQGYDPATRVQSTLVPGRTDERFGPSREYMTTYLPVLALDGDVVYYHSTTVGHEGLWARNTVNGSETMISPTGIWPAASNGHVVWLENGQSEQTLRIRLSYSPDEQIIIARSRLFPTIEYAISGDNVLWSANDWNRSRSQYGSASLMIYKIVLRSNYAVYNEMRPLGIWYFNLCLDSDIAVWAEEDISGRSTVWREQAYSINGQQQTTLSESGAASGSTSYALAPRTIVHRQAVAFTLGRVGQSSFVPELYLATLPSEFR